MNNDFIKYSVDQINQIPGNPGVYKYYDQNETLIYVGKAKNLKKRVQSYFVKQSDINWKTRKMVSEIRSIEFILVETELDALHLENSLIKKHLPKYNIRLKDDKSYPFLCITKERFPRIFSTRRYKKYNGDYFGPYANVKAMNNVLRLISSLYQLRTCKYDLSEENISKGKFKVCLEYHIKNCQGPCEGLQKEEDYLNDIEQARNIIKGKIGSVRKYFNEHMKEASENLNFEVAQKFKAKAELLEKYQYKSMVVNPKLSDLDVFTIHQYQKRIFVNYMKVVDGAITFSLTTEPKRKLDETLEETLEHTINQLVQEYPPASKELITNIELDEIALYKKQSCPVIGDKKQLIELSSKNVLFYVKEKLNNTKEPSKIAVLKKLKSDLHLQHTPKHIECFDNSNIQGTNPVASMVCFIDGKPKKSEYRKFNIKTVEGPDDFGSMTEVVGRRYKHLLEEELPLPDLIVIDGGKGQLNASVKALKELNIYGRIPIIGIAKRLEEVYVPEDQVPIHLEKKSESLRLIQQIRNEAHRFAINFHRNKRSSTAIKSSLNEIEGVGDKTIRLLLSKYKSIKALKEIDEKELSSLIGKHKASVVYKALQKEKASENNS
ncbi:MAG: excinuclease ABC subunit UvrC [Bacteroidota bacterium]